MEATYKRKDLNTHKMKELTQSIGTSTRKRSSASILLFVDYEFSQTVFTLLDTALQIGLVCLK